jgi:diaminopimelate decarboxylase
MSRQDQVLADVARRFGTPFFIYFLDEVRSRIDSLRDVFGGRFGISYAVKSNPNPALVAWMSGHVPALDISSGGELKRALAAGWSGDRISFTGPGKRGWELADAVSAGVGKFVLESVREAEDLDALAAAAQRVQPVLLRLAPASLPRGFGINMAGKPTQFGVDEEEAVGAVAAIGELAHLRLAGFHAYSGTQCVDAKAVGENIGIFARLFGELAARFDLRPEALVFGAGFGIPYHPGMNALDLPAVAAAAAPALDRLASDPRTANATLYLEMGRYLVGEAGLYVARVTRIKRSRGAEIAICDGGMNHHLGACGHLGSVIHRNYRIFKPGAAAHEARRTYELVGPLCTSIDTLGHAVELPELREGDLLGVQCSGAYGLTASPVNFISHEPPREFAVEGGAVSEVTDARIGAAWRTAAALP